MKYANVNNVKTHAKKVESGTRGKDLWYEEYEVVACVGKYRQYWKYADDKPVLPRGYEPETEWHSAWKNGIMDEYCEVVCGENREHRADIKTNKYVIEIQKSSIDIRDVENRNAFYKELTDSRVIWVVNVEEPWKKGRFSTELVKGEKDGRFLVEWKYKWLWVCDIAKTKDSHLYLDFNPRNDKLIHLWGYDNKLYGKWITKLKFFDRYLKDVANEEIKNDNEIFLHCFNEL
ncbi:MAG: hypothetical protein Q4C98_11305 [Capnocytophaga sp.]|nr:hypothetical protein [Capnocytophaga sp.]